MAESVGLKTKDLNGAMEALVGVTASVGKKGPFNIAGELNSKFMEKPVSSVSYWCVLGTCGGRLGLF